jgi:hypothetical protein
VGEVSANEIFSFGDCGVGCGEVERLITSYKTSVNDSALRVRLNGLA